MAGESWKKREDETAKSWAAFVIYRDLGPARSIAAAVEEMGRPPGYARWAEKWSVRYDWVARAEAFDAWEDEQRQAQRQLAREEARDVFVEAARELARRLVKLALSDGVTSAQVMAAKAALDRAGVTVPKEVDLNVSGAIERSESITDIVQSLEDKTTAELARAYFAAIEGDGEAEGGS